MHSYVLSRVFLHNPPGEGNALRVAPNAPLEVKQAEHELQEIEPETNPWACMILLLVTVAIMSATAEFVSNVHHEPLRRLLTDFVAASGKHREREGIW